MRKTRDGLYLIYNDRDGREDFRHALQNAVGDAVNVRTITPKTQLEIMDLDCVTTKDDVKNVLRRETGRDGDFGVHIFGPNRAVQFMAICKLET